MHIHGRVGVGAILVAVLLGGALPQLGCGDGPPPATPPTPSAQPTETPMPVATTAPAPVEAPNPLLQPWVGPYEGVPPLDKIKVTDFKPALEQAMAENLREVDAIANNPAPPTFDNTLVAMERSGQTLARVTAMFGVWSSAMSTADFQAVEKEMAPKLAAFSDKITQNAALFKRIQAVYESPDKDKLTPEQQRLSWFYYNTFSLQGAKLDPAQKAILSDYNQKLASLYTQFSQNELADEEGQGLVIDNAADLAGLSQSLKDGYAEEAEHRSQKGKWIVGNTRSAMEPFLTYSSNRALREKGWHMWTMRGDNGDAHDNNKNVTDILLLRAKKAKLLGSATYAHWHLQDTMAKKPENAMALMLSVWKPAVAQVHKDVADMQAIVDKEQKPSERFKIEPWDYRYYAEKVRKAKYDLNMDEVKPYLQLEQIREAMFWVAGQLYGFTFTPVTDLPVYQADMRVFEVKGANGEHVGYWYFDPYARAGKNSGAWMNAYREQQAVDRKIPTIVSNNSNFIKGKPGEPVTISWDDARTMFHEFGHALHGLNSNVTYPSLSGTNTPRDHVEFPSQLNENWLATPEVMNKFLINKDGQAIPPALVAKLKKAHAFNQGFSTVETQASAILDMKMHLAGEVPIDPHTFEKQTLSELGMPKEIVMRHRIPQFGHVFSGDGYATGYYGYIWAEVLALDAFDAFTEAGGPYDKAVAKRLHDDVVSVGNTMDPAEGYRKFRGRDPSVNALLRDHGFPVPTTPAPKADPKAVAPKKN